MIRILLSLSLFITFNHALADCPLKTMAVTHDRAPVIIVGAGLAGLITAYQLNKAGIKFIILETSGRIGGRVQTIYYPDNATAEAHMEEFWEKTHNYTLLEELKLPLVRGCPGSSLMIDGKIFPHKGLCGAAYLEAVFTPEERTAAKVWNDKTWSIFEQLNETHFRNNPLPPNLKAFTTLSFAEYVQRSNLPRNVSEWIRVNLEPEISIGWDQISALDGIEEMRILLETPDGYGAESSHVAGGNEKYIQALLDHLPKKSVLTHAFVTDIAQNEDEVVVTYMTEADKAKKMTGLYAVVTVPLFALNRIKFTPPLPQSYQEAINTTKFSSYIKVQYRVKREAEKLWANIGGEGLFPLLTDTEVGTIYNATDYEEQLGKDQNLIITLLLHGKIAKEWAYLPLEEILKRCNAQMDKLFPGFTSYITLEQVFSYPTAIAYWPLDNHRSRFDELAHNLRQPFNRVQIGGDTTDSSHSDGAATAALRMSKVLISKCEEK